MHKFDNKPQRTWHFDFITIKHNVLLIFISERLWLKVQQECEFLVVCFCSDMCRSCSVGGSWPKFKSAHYDSSTTWARTLCLHPSNWHTSRRWCMLSQQVSDTARFVTLSDGLLLDCGGWTGGGRPRSFLFQGWAETRSAKAERLSHEKGRDSERIIAERLTTGI